MSFTTLPTKAFSNRAIMSAAASRSGEPSRPGRLRQRGKQQLLSSLFYERDLRPGSRILSLLSRGCPVWWLARIFDFVLGGARVDPRLDWRDLLPRKNVI